MEILRNFAVFEGGDGSGTSTQLSLAVQRFAENPAQGLFFYPTAEPTGGPIGRLIRSALKNEVPMQPDTLARLFSADRGEHLYAADGIIERCKHGELVISDRYVLSSLVYQGIECGEELPRSLNEPFPAPELLLFFDIDPQIALERLSSRASLEIFERLEFQKKVRDRYHSLLDECRSAGVRVAVIDASKSVEKTAAEVWSALSKMPILKGMRSYF
ncbi:MAG: dTMP kinase [Treponema sp.]|jgi:dTMP kinase|nr:dTMP kinase [Treponema sp.]